MTRDAVSRAELTEYALRVAYTILFVFEQVVPVDTVLARFIPLLDDDDRLADLMHEEPLYIAAALAGIQPGKAFGLFEKRYAELSRMWDSESGAPSRIKGWVMQPPEKPPQLGDF